MDMVVVADIVVSRAKIARPPIAAQSCGNRIRPRICDNPSSRPARFAPPSDDPEDGDGRIAVNSRARLDLQG
jgi:hypothetical protein